MINRGSEWRRWEPHIHGPITILNNQYGGPNKWEDYLSALEAAKPRIEAIAVTDYYVTDTYEHLLREKAAGRLPTVELIFPNIELRLDVATSRGGFVNMHLFVSPEDSDHIAQLQRFISRLQFRALSVTASIVLALSSFVLDEKLIVQYQMIMLRSVTALLSSKLTSMIYVTFIVKTIGQ